VYSASIEIAMLLLQGKLSSLDPKDVWLYIVMSIGFVSR
jgi:hypothetical protein